MSRYVTINGNIASGQSTASFQLGDPNFSRMYVYRGSMSTATELVMKGSFDGTNYFDVIYPHEPAELKFIRTNIASGAASVDINLGDHDGDVSVYRGSMSTAADINIYGSNDLTSYHLMALPKKVDALAASNASAVYTMFIGSAITNFITRYPMQLAYVRFVATAVVSGGVSITVSYSKKESEYCIESYVTESFKEFQGPFPPFIKFSGSAVIDGGVSMVVHCV